MDKKMHKTDQKDQLMLQLNTLVLGLFIISGVSDIYLNTMECLIMK